MVAETLADVAEIIMGQSPPGSTVSTKGAIPLLNGPTEFGPSHPTPTQYTWGGRKFAEPGDLLFCVRGSTTGRMNWADQRYAIGRGVAAIRHRADPPLQPLVRAVLEHALLQLLAQATGSTFPNVSAQQLSGLRWPELDLDDQYAVAKIIGLLDTRIDLNRRMDETIEDIVVALFKSWFIDFNLVQVKQEDESPQLLTHIASLFPNKLVDSELGPIPSGWQIGTLGDIARNVRRAIQPEDIEPQTTYIALQHMPRNSLALSEWSTADDVASGKLVFRSGEILFGRLRPYFHKVGVAPVDGVCSTDIMVVSPISPAWFGLVLGHMSSTKLINYASAMTTGTRMPRTNWKAISSYEIAIPPPEVAETYTRLVRSLVDQIASSIHQSVCLARIRDTLLPHLLSERGHAPIQKLVGITE